MNAIECLEALENLDKMSIQELQEALFMLTNTETEYPNLDEQCALIEVMLNAKYRQQELEEN